MKHYYPVCTTTYLWILLETRRGNGHCKVCFNEAVILKRILNIFKSALKAGLKGLPCISNLSANAVFYSLSIFCWNFLNFVDTKNNFKDFIGKKLKYKQFLKSCKKMKVICIKFKVAQERNINLDGFHNTSKISLSQKHDLFEFALNVKVFLK